MQSSSINYFVIIAIIAILNYKDCIILYLIAPTHLVYYYATSLDIFSKLRTCKLLLLCVTSRVQTFTKRQTSENVGDQEKAGPF